MIKVVKIGGNVIDNPEALERFIDDFAQMPAPKILMHGGGKEATRLSAALGVETTMVDGRRITDAATLDVVTMVYAGLINKRIVAMLRARGIKAIGMCGADCGVITSHRREAAPVDYGFVGDIDKVDAQVLESFIDRGIVPVMCAITCSAEGQLLNSNADSVASAVAVGVSALGETELHFCFDKPGVLADVDNPASLIAEITPRNFAELKASGAVHGGMLPKIENALKACGAGVGAVYIEASVMPEERLCTVVSL